MFGRKVYREVEIATTPLLEIKISDFVQDDSGAKVWANFFLEKVCPLFIDDVGIDVDFTKFCFCVKHSDSKQWIVKKGWSDDNIASSAIVSRKYSTFQDALSFSVNSKHKLLILNPKTSEVRPDYD